MSLPPPNPHRSPTLLAAAAPRQRALGVAIAASLILHALILFAPHQGPREANRPAGRLQATLAPPATPAPAAPPSRKAAARPQGANRILALKKAPGRPADSHQPQWTTAEREDMNKFLRELDDQAKAGPDLAQRSLAMAREIGRETGRQQARLEEAEGETLERLPNSPPADPFSLEMYLDGLVKKLNRSAAFVKNDPRNRGMRTAAVLIRLNPNGSLRTFQVLNAADQQDEIAFIKSVVEQAVPFPAFPPDLRKSAQSLGMVICILPATADGGGFGFTRTGNGRHC